MNFYTLRSFLGSPWQVDAKTFMQYYPMLRGVLQGLSFGNGEEEDSSKPFLASLSTAQPSLNGEEKAVSIIPIHGIMLKHDIECGPKGMRTVGKRLIDREKPDNVVGSILLFESGGGQAAAVPEIADAIRACKKPVLAYIDGIACSAAMYAASYCREIIASRNTDEVGSIGTLIMFELFEKFTRDNAGMMHVRIYADGSDSKNEDFETALTGDFKIMKERVLNPSNEIFKNDMRANRPKITDAHLTGKTFLASEVMGVLVDYIGDLQFTINRVAAIAETQQSLIHNKSKIITMTQIPSLLAVLGVTELVIEDGQTSLNEQQLEAIETAFAESTQAQTSLQTAQAAQTKAEADLKEANAKIEKLQKLIEKKPGAESAEATAETDNDKENPGKDETFFGRLTRLGEEVINL